MIEIDGWREIYNPLELYTAAATVVAVAVAARMDGWMDGWMDVCFALLCILFCILYFVVYAKHTVFFFFFRWLSFNTIFWILLYHIISKWIGWLVRWHQRKILVFGLHSDDRHFIKYYLENCLPLNESARASSAVDRVIWTIATTTMNERSVTVMPKRKRNENELQSRNFSFVRLSYSYALFDGWTLAESKHIEWINKYNDNNNNNNM